MAFNKECVVHARCSLKQSIIRSPFDLWFNFKRLTKATSRPVLPLMRKVPSWYSHYAALTPSCRTSIQHPGRVEINSRGSNARLCRRQGRRVKNGLVQAVERQGHRCRSGRQLIVPSVSCGSRSAYMRNNRASAETRVPKFQFSPKYVYTRPSLRVSRNYARDSG